ncbi:GNAT family N-acetyltransferase [Afifella sp. YEN Y35]|uniref:GNAT family N-acetyltransferase n=1 Tax=Afifella sp. YEN Y35 TaxID=3388337 RepID=UPI0039E1DB5F
MKNVARRADGRTARTYVVCLERRVIAYYCLATGAVTRPDLPSRLRRDAPSSMPMMVLGRLAVDRRFAGRQIGSSLLRDAMRRTLQASTIVGCRGLVVHAIEASAAGFYAQYGFVEFPPASLALYLPTETIQAAL